MSETGDRPEFRVIDTGVRDGSLQIAFDQALVELRKAGAVPDTVRFLRFPPTALIGRHQDLSRELKLDHCREAGIGVVRRITGGGAIYLDEGQLGWELVCDRRRIGVATLADMTARICTAAAAGLSTLGIAAEYRPPTDIVVDGQKICGTGGYFDDDIVMYQGTTLVDLDLPAMMAAINVAAPKEGAPPPSRVTTLRALLPDADLSMPRLQAALIAGFEAGLGIACTASEPGEAEESLAQRICDAEIGTPDFIAGIDSPGADASVRHGECGPVNAWLRVEGRRNDRVREVLFTGDFVMVPPRLVMDLEGSLRGTVSGEVAAHISAFFSDAPPQIATAPPEAFAGAVAAAFSGA
ncbi:MAG: lipoate--protein ligase family protein [Rhodospirillaceae bacterium]|nr:lipoate--protein ligase family protein [Rhodospirillaceae bacterium]